MKSFIIHNQNLKINLINHHKIIYSFFSIIRIKKTDIVIEFRQTEEARIKNIVELYYIIETQNIDNSLAIVKARKLFLNKNISRIKNELIRSAYAMEQKHCIVLLEILEQKQKTGNLLNFDKFLEKMIFDIKLEIE